MSEHQPKNYKSPRYKPSVFVAPEEEEDDPRVPSVEQFLRKALSELMPRAKQHQARLNSMVGPSVEELLEIEAETVDGLSLLYGGMEPGKQRDQFAERLGPGWAKVKEAMKKNFERAQALLLKVN